MDSPSDEQDEPHYLPSAVKDAFLTTQLTAVDAITISEEDRQCPICLQQYDSDAGECAFRINACGHIFGRACLEKHVRGEGARAAQCPMCRGHLFDDTAVLVEIVEALRSDLAKMEEIESTLPGVLSGINALLHRSTQLGQTEQVAAMTQKQEHCNFLLADLPRVRADLASAIEDLEAIIEQQQNDEIEGREEDTSAVTPPNGGLS